jgi:uncharacterized protein (DUF488 family)
MPELRRTAGDRQDVTTTVYTVGHSNHEAQRFVALLRQHGIEQIVDVRSSPYSRYVPQANRGALALTLQEAGIVYEWLGDRLGGKPGGQAIDYDELRTSAPFRQGIADLLALAARARTAIMCAEGDHRVCHRHRLITPALLEREAHVIHIQPDGSLVHEGQEPRQLSLF